MNWHATAIFALIIGLWMMLGTLHSAATKELNKSQLHRARITITILLIANALLVGVVFA